MRGSRAVLVAGGCAAIVGAGWAASPKELPTLDLVAPSSPAASATPGATPSPTPTVSATAGATGASSTYDGPVVTNARGDYQARITVADGQVTDVQAVVAGTPDAQSVQINAVAIPALRDEVLAAQTWDVAAVSGASFTSPAFTESLRGAFEEAGL
ncbi:FMN-binding protein [Demequina soli]|uniref:FMN-binding protein n=1 Tax=Demequina soli TaxID=1638987 RepID=UPI000A506F22|nr:FMN-binding protein [Demequina soli]